MGDAIALSSPSGQMSRRALKNAQERLRVSLFGEGGLPFPSINQPSRREYLLHRAAYLRDIASRGMKPRAYAKEADRLELEANQIKL